MEDITHLYKQAPAEAEDITHMYAQSSPELPPVEGPPSSLEALGRGLEQGATFGFGDEINGALSTLLDSLRGKNSDLSVGEDYRKQRDESRANMKAAEEAHPNISMGANLAGGLLPAVATLGASVPEQAAVGLGSRVLSGMGTGLKFGALAGLGNSNADLTQGEVEQAAKDVGVGAGVGTGLGGVLGAASNPLSKLLSAIKGGAKNIGTIGPVANAGKVISQGLKGNVLIGENGAQKVGQNVIDRYGTSTLDNPENINNIVDTALGESKSAQQKALSNATEVNLGDFFTPSKSAIEAYGQTLEGSSPGTAADLAKVQQILDHYSQNGNLLSGKNAWSLKQALGKLGSGAEDGGLTDPNARMFVNRLLSPLTRDANLAEEGFGLLPGSDLMSTLLPQVPGLAEHNAKISSLLDAQKLIPSINEGMQQDAKGLGGTNAKDALANFYKNLPEDVSSGMQKADQELGQQVAAHKAIHAPTLSKGLIETTARGTIYGGLNAVAGATRALYDLTPEAIQNLASGVVKLGTKGSEQLGNILKQSADRDRIGRNALFFAIQQNPQYREILRQVLPNQEETPNATYSPNQLP